MESNSTSSSLDSRCSTVSTTSYTLRPRLPITYNKTPLSHLHGRPQVRTCNYLSIPLPLSNDDKEIESEADASAEVKADSPCTQDESLTSTTKVRLSLTTWSGVTNKPNNDRLSPMTRGGVTTGTNDLRTSMPDRPPAEEHSKNHQCATLTINIHPLDQAMTKGTLGKEA